MTKEFKVQVPYYLIQYIKGGTVIEYKNVRYIRCHDIPSHNYYSDLIMHIPTGELYKWSMIVEFDDSVEIIE